MDKAAVRAEPKDYFSKEEWARLIRRSSLSGPLMIAHAWIVILASAAVATLYPNIVTVPLAIMLIGARQLGLSILMHDAAHGLLYPNQKVNDFLGAWICGWPTGADLGRYRPYHLKHHKYVQGPKDPDLKLSAPFPITPKSLRRKIIRDLTGQTFFKQRLRPWFYGLDAKARATPAFKAFVQSQLNFVLVNLAAAAVLTALGLGWSYLVFWLVPLATWNPLVTRIRNIAEHACVKADGGVLTQARTTRANLIERALVAPYYVNYHLEHHMFMHLPCTALPRAHSLLVKKGFADRMEIGRSYLAVLEKAAPAA